MSVPSPADPFASCRLGGGGTVAPGSQVEPRLAVDPTNPARLLVVWQQDRWSGGGARGIVTGLSRDGGHTWTRIIVPFSGCAGDSPYQRASDPWVIFNASGIALATALGINANGSTAVQASRSTDGGLTWSKPANLTAGSTVFNDKESATFDPHHPKIAWVIWDRLAQKDQGQVDRGNSPAGTLPAGTLPAAEGPAGSLLYDPVRAAASQGGQIVLSKTADAGLTWSAPRTIAVVNGTPLGNQIAVLPNGTLVDVFELLSNGGPFEALIRSTDGGATWSATITIARIRSPQTPLPAGSAAIRSGAGIPDIAVDPRSGRLVVVWEDGRFRSGPGIDIAMAVSSDGGLTWSRASQVNGGPTTDWAFTPDVAITAAGQIAVAYSVLHSARIAATIPTDRFLRRSIPGGGWSEARLTAVPFDLRRAPNALGYFLGDYMGVAAAGNHIATVFIMPNSSGPRGSTHAAVAYE
ncbi:MAG TPA: sialidase family protein [Candidatus Saccharimonadales bacterium]|nr:sialidase family protein [Candidatus Saccharimonadales bacterium]